MKKEIRSWQFAGFAITSLLGTLLHFLYEWTDQNAVCALFSAVNESTWEHMKLLFVPTVVFAAIERRFLKDVSSFWCVKLIGTVTGLWLIPVLFYTYNGVFGSSPDLVNVSIFFVATAATFLTETKLLQNGKPRCNHPALALTLLFVIGTAFAVFTFFPPHIPLFQDPLTNTYGVISSRLPSPTYPPASWQDQGTPFSTAFL